MANAQGIDGLNRHGAFAGPDQEEVLAKYKKCAGLAASMGLGVNAGHDLNLNNLSPFVKAIPEPLEVSIGHALVCDALDFGWQKTIELYRAALDGPVLERVRICMCFTWRS